VSELGVAIGSAEDYAPITQAAAERIEVRFGRDALLRRILASADLAAIAAVALVMVVAADGAHVPLMILLSAPVWIVIAKLLGLYDQDQKSMRHLTVDELPRIVVWAFIGATFRSIVTLPFPSLAIDATDRLVVLGSSIVFAFAFRATGRALWRRFTPPERVLIVGDGPTADAVVRKLELFPDLHAEIEGQLASCADLRDRLDDLDGVDRIVLASGELDDELLDYLLPICRLRAVKLTIVPPTRGVFGTATHLGHVADMPLLDYNTWDISQFTLVLKRSFDVAFAAVALIVAAPLFALIALAIVLDDGMPVLFRQVRAGEGGRPFSMLKFRTMVKDAEALLPELVVFDELDHPMFKLRTDPRVTRVGSLLRRTSLDELPQLVNVLRGEMSIVGPRPEQLDLVERYQPEHAFRLKVRPGITGPMQVFGRGELRFEERLAVEREYIENLSLARDARILLLTMPVVFGRRGAF